MDLWIFDNDGTLYDDRLAGEEFMGILLHYLSSELSLPISYNLSTLKELRSKWQTSSSVVALIREHALDFAEVVSQTYSKIELSRCVPLPEEANLVQFLEKISAPKIVFTNNPSAYARRVLQHLGADRHFTDIIGMEELNFQLKPLPEAYLAIQQRYPGFQRYIFCDDRLENLVTAKQLGWLTIWLKPIDNNDSNKEHFIIDNLTDILSLPCF